MNSRLNFSHLADLCFSDSSRNEKELQVVPVCRNVSDDIFENSTQKLSPYFFDDIIKKYSHE